MTVEKVSENEINDLKSTVQEERDFKKSMQFMQDDSVFFPKGEVKEESSLGFNIGEPIEISKSLLKKLKKNGDIE